MPYIRPKGTGLARPSRSSGPPGPYRAQGGCRRPAGRFLVFVLIVCAVFGFVWLRHSQWLMRYVYPFNYRASITSHAEANGLDPLMVAAVIKAESNFWPWARSGRDARGLMQVTPQTGSWVADQVGMGDFEDQALYDPEVNLQLGCWYLAYLIRQYDGRMPVVLAAWNGGLTNVNSWLADGTWSGELDDAGKIPFGETRDFVVRVLEYLSWYERLYGEEIR